MNILKKIYRKLFKQASAKKYYYSQCGEDIIANRILRRLGIDKPTYLDIGANHPVNLNNTYLMYTQDSKGVLVEPDPVLASFLKKKRKHDTVLNIGIGREEGIFKFYRMSNEFLNTFSEEQAKNVESYGKDKIVEIIDIPQKTLLQVIADNFEKTPNFVSIDIEGEDFEILKSLDLTKHRPEVICIETITYTQDNSEEKRDDIIDYLKQHEYLPYGDTHINTIFVDHKKWKNR